jgi:hypothetical protein
MMDSPRAQQGEEENRGLIAEGTICRANNGKSGRGGGEENVEGDPVHGWRQGRCENHTLETTNSCGGVGEGRDAGG